MPPKTLSVDLYLRMSEADDQAGVERQETEARAFVEARGWAVRQVFVDNDISASKGKLRPGFEALLKARSEAIVVWHIDRLVRVSKDLERVIELGVNVYACLSGHVDLSNPAGRAVARTVTAWATYEGEQKSERQKAAHRQRAASGKPWWPSRPFGFETDGAHRKVESKALAGAYRDVLAGVPLRRIAAGLNDAGLLTNKGNPWTAMTLGPVLKNPRNAAIVRSLGREMGAAAWKPIVSEDTFRAAVRVLDDPSRKVGAGNAPSNLLTGIATCGKCGADVKTGWRGGRAGEVGAYRTYVCRASSCVSHRGEFTDQLVVDQVIAYLSSTPSGSLQPDVDGDALSGARIEVARLRERASELRLDYADGVFTRAEFLELTARVKARIAEAEFALRSTDGPLSAMLDTEDVALAWKKLPSLEHRREVLNAVVESVALMPRGRGRAPMREEDVVVKFVNDKKPPIG